MSAERVRPRLAKHAIRERVVGTPESRGLSGSMNMGNSENSTVNGRQAGFTLAELLVTLLVGSILLSVGVPSYTTFVRNANQVSSANEFLSALHFARDLAVTRNVRVAVCASAGGADCEATTWENGWIVFADQDDSRTVSGAETLARVNSSISASSAASAEFPSLLV